MNKTIETNNWNEAQDIFSRVFFSLTRASSDIHTFREGVALGEPHATDRLVARNRDWAERFLADPDNDKFFLDKKGFVEITGGAAAMERALTSAQIQTVNRSVSAASLVFMHSALDGSTHDLCRVCALAAPTDWEQFVMDQKVTFRTLKQVDLSTLLEQQLTKVLATLERQSLLHKVERLLQLCKPSAGFTPVKGYSFDRPRLEAVDKERHSIVHGSLSVVDAPGEKVDFMRDTGLFLFGLVNAKYGIKMDPATLSK